MNVFQVRKEIKIGGDCYFIYADLESDVTPKFKFLNIYLFGGVK